MSPAGPKPAPELRGAGAPARIFAALGDPTRLAVVARLCRDGPTSIARLTEGSAVTRQAVAKHLRVLAQAGLVRGRRRGRESLWELEPERLEVARRYLDTVSQRWDATLERLRAVVEP
ncbi:MAG: ArsR/SmtB family transcription factor [Acidobacteriota bacterium]